MIERCNFDMYIKVEIEIRYGIRKIEGIKWFQYRNIITYRDGREYIKAEVHMTVRYDFKVIDYNISGYILASYNLMTLKIFNIMRIMQYVYKNDEAKADISYEKEKKNMRNILRHLWGEENDRMKRIITFVIRGRNKIMTNIMAKVGQ